MNPPVPPLSTNSNPDPKNGLAISSFVLGIVSILAWRLGLLFAILAIISGHTAHWRARRSPDRFSGGKLAIAGLGMGYLSAMTVIIATWMLPHRSPDTSNEARAKSISCVSRLILVTRAAHEWAAVHGNLMPKDLKSLGNYLNSPHLLICPGDSKRSASKTWNSIGTNNVSYEIVSPAALRGEYDKVFIRCAVHGHEAMVDASVRPKHAERDKP